MEGAVGAELDVDFRGVGCGGEGRVEGLDDLGGEGGACDGADRVAVVVGEGELVCSGEGGEVCEGGGGEEGRGWDAGVVDCGYVDEVED